MGVERRDWSPCACTWLGMTIPSPLSGSWLMLTFEELAEARDRSLCSRVRISHNKEGSGRWTVCVGYDERQVGLCLGVPGLARVYRIHPAGLNGVDLSAHQTSDCSTVTGRRMVSTGKLAG